MYVVPRTRAICDGCTDVQVLKVSPSLPFDIRFSSTCFCSTDVAVARLRCWRAEVHHCTWSSARWFYSTPGLLSPRFWWTFTPCDVSDLIGDLSSLTRTVSSQSCDINSLLCDKTLTFSCDICMSLTRVTCCSVVLAQQLWCNLLLHLHISCCPPRGAIPSLFALRSA